MAQIVQQGALNTTALVVPDLYVQIVPPQTLYLNGVPTNRIGAVGTASWGPVNQPVTYGTMQQYASTFGPIMARKYDLGTVSGIAVQQGAQDFRGVRVTDGTDVAASGTLGTNWLTVTSLYTGSAANGDAIVFLGGSRYGTSKIIVARPGLVPEVFDNIAGTGNALAINAAAAINGGLGVLRGKSALIVATPGAGTTAPAGGTNVVLAGGTDGAATITAATLIGQDAAVRTGMYALRGQGCSIGVLADADDSTQWTTQAGFGLSEGLYMITVGPSGDTIANAVAIKASAGLDSYAVKHQFGDWLYWNDQANQVLRLVSPQGFVAGRLANLSPENSSLNKQLYGVVGSQKSGVPGSASVSTYSTADLTQLFSAGIDVVSNPQPGGSYWGVRCGHNSSSNPAINGDNYTRMTNYLASTLAAGMGIYVGQVINAKLFERIRTTEYAFLDALLGQGLLGSTDGSIPYAVQCDIKNNPVSRTALGYVQSDAQVQYQGINEKFIVNLQGGTTVTVTRASTAPNA